MFILEEDHPFGGRISDEIIPLSVFNCTFRELAPCCFKSSE
jgi:hypothetical protein